MEPALKAKPDPPAGGLGSVLFLPQACGMSIPPSRLKHPSSGLPDLLNTLPFPVAFPLAHAAGLARKNQPPISITDRFGNLIFGAEQMVRLSGLLLLADYLQCETSSVRLAPPIRSLRMPHWGEWTTLTSTLAKFWRRELENRPEKDCHFPWLPRAWREFASSSEESRWSDSLKEFQARTANTSANVNEPVSLNRVLWRARNDFHHRRAIVTGDALDSEKNARAEFILENLLPLVIEAATVLFPPEDFSLCFRNSSPADPRVRLHGTSLEEMERTVCEPDWKALFDGGRVVARSHPYGQPSAELDLFPLIDSLITPQKEEDVGLLERFSEKDVTLLGVRGPASRPPLVAAIQKAIGLKQIDLKLEKKETGRDERLAAASRARARDTLGELLEKKYFPLCYVPRKHVEDSIQQCLQSGHKALLLLGQAGSGKSSLLCRWVDRLTRQPDLSLDLNSFGEVEDCEPEESSDMHSGDVVIFLSGRAAYGGDEHVSGHKLLVDCVLQRAGIESGAFNNLTDLIEYLDETVDTHPTRERLVWFVFDGINEADRFRDLLSALDPVLPLVEKHRWLRILLSIRSGAYHAIAQRNAFDCIACPGVFSHESFLYRFHDSTGQSVPYLELREFDDGECEQAYNLRYTRLPERSCSLAWRELSAPLQVLLRSPLLLHIFHETFRHSKPGREIVDEDALFKAFLDHVRSEMPGLRMRLADIGRLMFQSRQPGLPMDVADDWVRDWRARNTSPEGRIKLTPIEELVSASLLLRPAEEGYGVDRKLASYQFTHQKICERVLLEELDRQTAGKEPTPEQLLSWAERAAPSDALESFSELVGALASRFRQLFVQGRGDAMAVLLQIADPVSRERILAFCLRAAVHIKSGEVEKRLISSFRKAVCRSPQIRENIVLLLGEQMRKLALTGFSELARRLCEVCIPVLWPLRNRASSRTQVHHSLGILLNQLADLHSRKARPEQARRCLLVAFRFLDSLQTNAETEDPRTLRKIRHDLSQTLYMMGCIAMIQRRFDESHRSLTGSVEILRQMVQSEPELTELSRSLCVTLRTLADLAVLEKRRAKARKHLDECLRLAQSLVEKDPYNSEWRSELGIVLDKLGEFWIRSKTPGRARAFFEESLKIDQMVLEEEPQRSDFKRDRSTSLRGLGELAFREGRMEEAFALCREACELLRQISEDEPQRSDVKHDLGLLLNFQGRMFLQNGQWKEARDVFQSAESLLGDLVKSQPESADLPAEWKTAQRGLERALKREHRSAAIRSAKARKTPDKPPQ
jgi:tetratricopeptide (TPR) repeat protein